MHVFLTGASGYVGGSIAAQLIAAGHQVTGLARNDERAALLREREITPVVGTLDDFDVLDGAARAADAVINAADADNPYAARVLTDALRGSGKRFVQTSGTSIVSDNAGGYGGGVVYSEDTPLDALPEKAGRNAIDKMICDAAKNGEAAMIDVNRAIGRLLGIGEATEIFAMADALRAWGPAMAHAMSSDVRVNADKARAMLDWAPHGPALFDDIENGSYRVYR